MHSKWLKDKLYGNGYVVRCKHTPISELLYTLNVSIGNQFLKYTAQIYIFCNQTIDWFPNLVEIANESNVGNQWNQTGNNH